MGSPSPTPTDARPPGFVHVDCDGLWSVLRCYGAQPEPDLARDPFWLEGVPAALRLLERFQIPATFFLVAQDLRAESHLNLARRILGDAHEIGNHSQTHPPDLRRWDRDGLRGEICGAQGMFEQTLGFRPIGFRSPGFSFRPALFPALRDCGLRYDSSILPSPWGPALRLARRHLGHSSQQGQQPYGGLAEGWARRGPHRVDGDMWEIPVSVTRWLRLPAHASFALLRSEEKTRRLVQWHAHRRIPFVFLIHLIDLCDTERLDLPVPRWSRRLFCQPAAHKCRRMETILGWITEHFQVQRTDDWVRSELDRLADPGDRKGSA